MHVWFVRGLLAGWLLFASEILLWTDPTGRPPLDWVWLVVGYMALAALLLDFAARYRARDVFGLLALAGIYGLLSSLALNPQTALADVPRTWATRVLGAHTLAGAGALACFLWVAAARWRWFWAVAGGIGLVWGVWVRWLPALAEITTQAAPPEQMLLAAVVPLLGLGVLLRLSVGWPAHLHDLQLGPVGRLVVAGVLLALLIRHWAQVDLISLGVLLALAVYCWLMVWFQKREQGTTLLDSAVPVKESPLGALLVPAGLFLLAGAAGYHLPFENSGILAPLVGLFAAFGLVWLPTVSLVLGVRAYQRLGRQRRL